MKFSNIRESLNKYYERQKPKTVFDVVREVLNEGHGDFSRNKAPGDLNEVLLAYYIMGENWNRFDDPSGTEKAMRQMKKDLGKEVYETQNGRAKVMAEEIKKWLSETDMFDSKPRKAWWIQSTNNSGLTDVSGQEINSRENPTDVLLQFRDGKFLGISAKSTKEKNDYSIKNFGIGTLGKMLNKDFQKIIDRYEKKAIKDMKLPQKQSERNKYLSEHPRVKKKVEDKANRLLTKLRGEYMQMMQEMDQEELRKHISKAWLDVGEEMPLYFIRVSGHGKNGSYTANVEDPMKNTKFDALSNGEIEVTKMGEKTIGVKVGDEKIMKIRFKYTAEKLSSSIKLSGEPY